MPLKIIVEQSNDPIIISIAQALSVSGLNPLYWNIRQTSAFDMVKMHNPDLIIISRENNNIWGEEVAAAANGRHVYIHSNIFDMPYCTNPIINVGVKEVESYKTRFAIIDDKAATTNFFLQNCIDILEDHKISNYRIYGGLNFKNPHFVGRISQNSYGYIYKNSANVIDINGNHFGNAELHGNNSIWPGSLINFIQNGESNTIDHSNNCFKLTRLILESKKLYDQLEDINEAENKYYGN